MMRIVLTRREALDVPDGINIFIFSLADALQKKGHEVIVVSTAVANVEKIKEYFSPDYWPGIIALGSHTEISYKRALATWMTRGKRVIDALRADFLIVNGAVPLRFAAATCTVSHDAEARLPKFPWLRTAFKRMSYAKSDLIVATCTEVQAALAHDLQIDLGRIQIIPTCVKVSNYTNKPFHERDNAVLHMGTVPYKNPMSSLRAFARIARPDRRLYVTGKPTAEMNQFLAGLEPGVKSQISFLGFVSASRLLELLGSVKIVSVPSIYNAAVASPTALESLASGTPVVASTSISNDLMDEGRCGYVCAPEDIPAIADAYEQLFSDEKAWRTLSRAGRAAISKFCSNRVADMYVRAAESEHGATGSVGTQVAGVAAR